MRGPENNRNTEVFSFRQMQQYDFMYVAYEKQASENWSV